MSREPATTSLPSETSDASASNAGPLWAGDADGAVMVARQAAVQFDLDQVYGAGAGIDADAHAWDANVPLAVDPGLFGSIDATLDMLTATPDLFDIPALDAGGGDAPAA